MTLSERINQDMKTAMKSGDTLRLETLRTVKAHFIELTKRGSDKPVTAEDEIAVLTSAIKKRKEAIEMFEKAGRRELVEQETAELAIISSYLPKQMSREEAATRIRQIITETGSATVKDFGKVMGVAMKELKGKIDGAVIQQLVKESLGG